MADDPAELIELQREIGHAIILALNLENSFAPQRRQIHERFRELTKLAVGPRDQMFGGDYLIEWIFPFLRDAHKNSCIHSKIYDLIFLDIERISDICEYKISLYHLFYKQIPIDLFNAKLSFENNRTKFAIGSNRCDNIIRMFDIVFPKIKQARDSLTHAHARNFGHSNKPKMEFSTDDRVRRQLIRGLKTKIELMDENGKNFDFFIDPPRFEKLYAGILQAISE